jgi:vesicle coat complex subunit
MHELDPKLMEEQGFLKMLENLLSDGNAMVVANAVSALQSIMEGKGSYSLNLNFHTVQKLLTALNECNEWGETVIIDALVTYIPTDDKEAEEYID